jgi:serine phosphatase RsbU (regulator of sigma subunit)
MVSPPHEQPATVVTDLLHALVNLGPALVVCDARARVRLRNEAAGHLFPALADAGAFAAPDVPGWLHEAHHGGAERTEGAVAGRWFTADRSPLPDGDCAWMLRDVTAEREAARRLGEARERSAFLDRASGRLLATLNRRKCLCATAELAADRLADAASVVIPGPGRRTAVATAVAGGPVRESAGGVDVTLMPGLAEALAGFPPGPSRWVDPARVPGWLLPPGFGVPGSVVVTPLPGNGVPAGALVLLRRDRCAHGFTDEEEMFARTFAARAGAALSAAALYADTSETNALLQQSLLPPPLTRVPGMELAGSYRAAQAAHRIGGDFYDIHPPAPHCRGRAPRAAGPDGDGDAAAPHGGTGQETFLVLGDVCGKGTGAAILTGKIRNTLAALRHVETRHDRLLSLLNDTLLSDDGDTRFATMVLAGATPAGQGRLRLRLTSAGHPPPLLVRGDGRVQEAPTQGTLIGAVPRVTFTTWETELRPGELCLLYSDGVTEARGATRRGEMFGQERLRAALTECAGMPARAVVERVEMLTAEWLGHNEHDDIALLAVAAPRLGGRGPRLTAVEGSGPGRALG